MTDVDVISKLIEKHRQMEEFYSLAFAHLNSPYKKEEIYLSPDFWNDIALELKAEGIEFVGIKDGDNTSIRFMPERML